MKRLERSEPQEYQEFSRIKAYLENEAGVFSIQENKAGLVTMGIRSKSGVEVDLSRYLPKGYAIAGKKITFDNYLGLSGGTDISLCDEDKKLIVIGEAEILEHGWKYLLTYLHEIGHAVRHENDPSFKIKVNQAFQASQAKKEDVALYKQSERLIAEEERGAWTYAVIEFFKLMKELKIPPGLVFDQAKDVFDFIRTNSLAVKALDVVYRMKDFKLKVEEQDELFEAIRKIYGAK